MYLKFNWNSPGANELICFESKCSDSGQIDNPKACYKLQGIQNYTYNAHIITQENWLTGAQSTTAGHQSIHQGLVLSNPSKHHFILFYVTKIIFVAFKQQ